MLYMSLENLLLDTLTTNFNRENFHFLHVQGKERVGFPVDPKLLTISQKNRWVIHDSRGGDFRVRGDQPW